MMHFSLARARILYKTPSPNTEQLLDFETGPRGDTFTTTNGYQLFPPSLNAGKSSFYVTQIDPETNTNLRLLVTGYTFRYNGAETVSEQGTELLPMTLQIASLEGVAVAPPVLKINVLKDTNGHLMIASFDTAKAPKDDVVMSETDCNEWPLLCKWKGIVAERIEQMKKMGKGCNKRPHGEYNPMAEDTWKGKPPHRFRPGRPHPHHHHRPHHKGHGHHSHSHVQTFARRAFFTILLPIIVGIFAGTVTYLIGMVLGTLIAIVIAKVRGQEYQRVALEEIVDVEEGEVVVESEKKEYAELPAYDAPPVYEEASDKEADESK
jgi:hypothetical protein